MKLNPAGCTFQPLIIIGAARSGTKLLRDLIELHPEIDKVPYDVNYVWRIGNEHLEHDELSPQTVTKNAQQRIQQQIGRFSQKAPVLVEKTVSNCLRVPFIDAVYPDARYIHLVRDGYDVVESVYRQWTRSPDWTYLLQKAKTFPVRTAPRYAATYAGNMAKRLFLPDSKKSRSWGPRYQEIDADLQSKSLLEVCAIQWMQCINSATRDFATLSEPQDNQRVLTIRYESFVEDPLACLEKVATFIDLDPTLYQTVSLPKVEKNNIGKGTQSLNSQQIDLITPIIKQTNAEIALI